MKLSPLDIKDKSFEIARRGYDPVQVDEFLEKVALAFRKLQDEARRACLQANTIKRALSHTQQAAEAPADTFLAAAEAKHKLLGEAEVQAEEILTQAREEMERAHSEAQEMRGATIEPARSEARQILEAAEEEAERTRREAHQEAKQILSQARQEALDVPAGAPSEAQEPTLDENSDEELEQRPAIDPDDPEELSEVERLLEYRKQANGDLLRPREEPNDGHNQPEEAVTEAKPTRYTRRSAGLPTLGAQAESVLSQITTVRGSAPQQAGDDNNTEQTDDP